MMIKIKEKLMKALNYGLLMFTYPRQLAEAVNRALTNEELDQFVSDDVGVNQ